MGTIYIPNKKELKLIKDYISYNPITGKLFWIKLGNSKSPIGQEIKRPCNHGYYRFTLKGKHYKAHRVAWFLYHNEWPNLFIDHINGIRNDNRISNLALVSRSGNNQNRPEHRNGLPVGVTKIGNLWRAMAPMNFLDRKSKKVKYLGMYKTMEDAGLAVIRFCRKGKYESY